MQLEKAEKIQQQMFRDYMAVSPDIVAVEEGVYRLEAKVYNDKAFDYQITPFFEAVREDDGAHAWVEIDEGQLKIMGQ